MRRTLITTLAAFALSTGAAVAADAPDSVLIGGKVEVKLGDNQGNVLAALSTVYKLEPYASETGTAFAVKTPEGKMVGTVAFDAKEPGAMPPISPTWAMLPTKPHGFPSWKTAFTTRCSGMWHCPR